MVKCSECGFLASRNFQSRELEETEQKTRDAGIRTTDFREGVYRILHEPPVCFMRASNLLSESKTDLADIHKLADTSTAHEEEIRSIIQKERVCDSFTKWHQGFTPKEHQEIIDRERQRKWHVIELTLIIVGNIFAGFLGALLTYLLTRSH